MNVQAETLEAGDLITCVETDAVYYYGEDGNRYVFQNEAAYFSWEDDFDNVVTISCDDLADIQLVDIVPYQAGTQLVKIPSVPTVYAVESDGTLREIPDEETAKELYGEDWANLVDDLDESFFPQYEVGEPLGDDEMPQGMILKDENGVYYVVDGDGAAVEATDIIGDGTDSQLDDFAVMVTDLIDEILEVIEYYMDGDEDFEEKLDDMMAKHGFVNVDDDEKLDDNEHPDFMLLTDEEIEELHELMDDEKDEDFVDTDGDGLSDEEEENVWGTDPNNFDTDGDGFGDGDEILHGFDPLGDGMLDEDNSGEGNADDDATGDDDKDEDHEGSDDADKGDDDTDKSDDDTGENDEPADDHMDNPDDEDFVDTDGDGLSDEEEEDVWGTDPDNFDTDGDGFGDGDEILAGFDPLTDESTGEAVENGSDDDEDEDDGDKSAEDLDDLDDADDVDDDTTGEDLPPLDDDDEDIDGDGLIGTDENAIGTNPSNPDTDGDGVNDGQEVLDGTDPLDSSDLLEDMSGDDPTGGSATGA